MSSKLIGKNYVPRSIGFGEGFLGPKGNVGYVMRFSMDRVKKLLKTLDRTNVEKIEAGLAGDWNENHCTIYDGEGWHEYKAWDWSIWATPIIMIKYTDRPVETYECYDREELPTK